MKKPLSEWIFCNLPGIIVGIWALSIVVSLSLLGLLGYVAFHFISKYW